METVSSFLKSGDKALILKGAAGTGKTSILKAVVDYLKNQQKQVELWAPTGCAAMNLSEKTDYQAGTIHSGIYKPETDEERACVKLLRKVNQVEGEVIYIIDESSMISNRVEKSPDFESETPMLSDLIAYVRSGHSDSKIIFVGDEFQLPPIKYDRYDTAPALDMDFLRSEFGLRCSEVSLSKVMRQAEGSYILEVATEIRDSIRTGGRFLESIGKPMYKEETVTNLYLERFDERNPRAAVILSFTNDYARRCNYLVRQKLGLTGTIAPGDMVVPSRNFYGYHNTYIPSGEVLQVEHVGKINKVAEMEFMRVGLKRFSRGQEAEIVDVTISLDYLQDPKSITIEKRKALFAAANKNNPIYRKTKDSRDDEYLSAMQLGYAHAMTCHKAQGSEWNTVFFNTWMPKNPDLRFLYTGVTRARKELFTNNSHRYA
ncbi:AAA family ATPase [Cellulophaga sp. BC115SP]|nr:AAA family ATPase [Cellulophaga sp. BC115SP]